MRKLFPLLLLLAFGAGPSRADTLTFDADTTPPATDGAGTWDTTMPNWYNGVADIAWPNTSDTAAFGAGVAGTYAIGVGTVNAGGITFNQGGYTLSGGTITMTPVNAAAGFTLATNGGADTLLTALAGPANSKIIKTGPGTLTLTTVTAPTAVATITGGAFNSATRLFDSILQVGYGNVIGTAPASSTVQYILDAGTLRFTGGGAIALAATRTVQVNAAGGAINDSVGNNAFYGQIIDNATGGSFHFSNLAATTSTLANTAIISGPGSFTFNGAGTAILQAINTYTGGTTVNAGTLTLAAGGGAGAIRGAVTVNPGANLILAATDALGYTAGTQVTTLNINGGRVDNIVASGNRNQGFRTSLNLTGGTLANSGGGDFRMAVGDATAPGITSNASATTSTITPNIDIFNGTLSVNVASGSTPSGIDLQAAGFFTAAGSLTKSGAGVFALNGGSTYGGATTINAGSVVLNPYVTTVSGGAGKVPQLKPSLTGQGASLPNSNITLAPAASLRLIAGDLPVTLGAAPGAVAPLSGNITATGVNSLRIVTGATISPGTYDVLTTNQTSLGAGTFQLDGAATLSVPAVSLIKQFGGTTNAGGTNGGTFYRLTVQNTATAAQVVVSPAPANVVNIMPIGSSTTEGVSSQPDGYSGGGYRSGLYQMLVNDGRFTPNFVGSNTVLDQAASGAYNVLTAANQLHHEGHGGYVASQVLTSLNYGASWLATNSAGQPTNGVIPDYITLAIGSNDFSISAKSTSPHPIPLADLVAPINKNDAIVTYIANTLRPGANIILGTFFYRVETNSGDIEVIGDLQNTYYNAVLPSMVFNHVLAGHHVSMADLYSAVTPNNNISQVGPDGIHSLTTGYNLMADSWYQALAFGSAYWKGGQDNQWSTVNAGATNFAQNYQLTTPRQTALTPSADVHFNSNTAALPTTLGQDIAVRGVNFAAGAAGPVTVGGANTLTLGVGGITVQAGTGAHSILSNVALGADQTWGNVSNNPFVVNGVISGNFPLKLAGTYTIYDQVNAASNGDAVVARSFAGTGPFVFSNANTYTGPTAVSSGTLVVNNPSGSATGTGSVTIGSGATLTDNGAIGGSVFVNGATNGNGTFNGAVTVNNGGVFGTAGTVNGPLNIAGGGTLMLSSGTLTANGGVVNSGTIRLARGASLAVGNGGTFVNNGVLDIITGSFTAPAGFINNGVIIDSSVVKTTSASLANGAFTLTVNGYSGHTYQLQSSPSLADVPFTNVGAPLSGTTGSVLTFTDNNPSGARKFYRVQVDQ